MISSFRPWRLAFGFLLGLSGILSSMPARGQTPPWADANYRYRRPLTISNTSGSSIATGDVIAYSYIPGYGPYDSKMNVKDIKIFWQPDNDVTPAHTEVKQAMVDLGATSAKILFSVKAPIDAGTAKPFIKGTDTSTFQETGTAISLQADEQVRELTLPFAFPFLGGNYTKATISPNGWVAFEPNLTDTYYGDPMGNLSYKNTLSKRKFIAPLGYDLDTSSYINGADVFYDTSVAGQATIRWKADTFTNTTVRDPRVNMSVTLFSDGRVRLNYGSIVTPVTNEEPPFGFVMGIATGSITDDLLTHLPVPYNLSNHAPILYTPTTRNVTTDNSYYIYYGNAADVGTRTAPDAAKLTYYSFKTNPASAAQGGWVAASGNPDTGTVARATITGNLSVLKVNPTTVDGKPLAIAAQGPDFTDQTIYTRLMPTAGGGVGVMARANANNQGYGYVLNDFSSLDGVAEAQQGIIVRTSTPNVAPDYSVISGHAAGAVSTTVFANVIMRVTGSGANTNIQAKAFNTGSIEPSGFVLESMPTDAALQFASGKIGVTGSGGGGTDISVPQANFMYVVPNGFAEYVTVAVGTDATEIEQPPPPGKGTLKGVVSDATTTAPIPGINVTITPSGGGTAITPAPTNNVGQYSLYLDPGSYTVSFASAGYNELIQTTAVVANTTTVLNGTLTAPELVTNGGFETPDPAAAAYKPLGWFRRNYISPTPLGVTLPQPVDGSETYNPGWRYVSGGAHSGNRCVEIRGPYYTSYPQTNGTPILSWEPEGTVLDLNADATSFGDCNSKGPMIPEATGATIHVSAWVKKSVDAGGSAGGQAILRLRPDIGGDDPSVLQGGNSGVQVSKEGSFGWTEVSYDFTVPSSVNGNYLQTRLYGSGLLDGNSIYWDDVSAHRVQFPVFRGVVHSSPASDGTVTPMAGITVGIREATANGMATPLASVDTDALGRWSLSFLPQPGVNYVVQAYPDVSFVNQHVTASANFPLQPATSITEIVYDPIPTIDIALRRPVLAYSSREDASMDPSNAFDDGNTRWTTDGTLPAGSNPRGYDKPQFLVVDLGQTYDFSKVAQIAMQSYNNGPDHYQWRVSNTPPPSNPDLFTYVQAASYGSLVYDSPVGIGSRWAQTPGYQAYVDIVTAPSLKPVSGRYLELYIDKFYGFNYDFSFYEIKVETLSTVITGKVVDQNNNPVASAVVGAFPDPTDIWVTDANGKYTAELPDVGTYTLYAHKPSSAANTVQPLSSPGTFTSFPGVTGPTLALGPEVSNVTIGTSSDRPDLQTTTDNPPSAAGDSDFTTKWETDLIGEFYPAPIVTPDNPVHVIADLGSTKPINTVVINWVYDTLTAHYVNSSRAYAIEVSTDGSTYTPVHETQSGTGGYSSSLPTGGRAVAPYRFATTNARFVRLTISGHIGDYLGIYELQVGNAAAITAPFSLADTQRAMRIAAGLLVATPADITRLSKDGVKITVQDVVRINKAAHGL